MDRNLRRWLTLLAVIAAILLVFVIRTALAQTSRPPRLFDLFDGFTALASMVVLAFGWRKLTRVDWLIGLGAGLLMGALLPFATLYSPYPFFQVVTDLRGRAVVNGLLTAVTAWGGLVIMRWGGPVKIAFTLTGWRAAGHSLLVGIAVGLPFAVLNGLANGWMQHRPVTWQNPLAAAMDALHPAIVEEVIYRFALLGLLWLVFRRDWPPRQALWLAGLLALLTHTYAHFSDEFVTQPLTALGIGLVMGAIWGIPLTVLALRRDLESAIGFHWMQDAIRFWFGF
jgi:hypothetical protein